MLRVLLDSNVYNLLASDRMALASLQRACHSGRLQVLATPVVLEELQASPFRGIPSWSRAQLVPEGVAVVGHAFAGWCSTSNGEVYQSHTGQSNKTRDGIIAESAHQLSDALVSNDRRCRERLRRMSDRCLAWSFSDFKNWLATGKQSAA